MSEYLLPSAPWQLWLGDRNGIQPEKLCDNSRRRNGRKL